MDVLIRLRNVQAAYQQKCRSHTYLNMFSYDASQIIRRLKSPILLTKKMAPSYYEI